jgi:hypothetical protein
MDQNNNHDLAPPQPPPPPHNRPRRVAAQPTPQQQLPLPPRGGGGGAGGRNPRLPQQQNRTNPSHATMTDSNMEWFRGAPVSKGILTLSIVLYLIVNHYHSTNTVALWKFDSFILYKRQQQWYRYISSKVIFESNSEVILGTALQLFLYRKFEREFGTYQFLRYVFVIYALTILQEVMVFQLLRIHPVHWSYCGPYCLLGALFLYFHWYVPRLHPRFVSMLNFHFSEKSLYYFWFLYLIIGSNHNNNSNHVIDGVTMSGWKGTMIAVLMGMIASAIYHSTSQNPYLLRFDRMVQTTIVRPIVRRMGWDENPTATTTLRGGGVAQHPMAAHIAAFAGQQRMRQRQAPLNATPPILANDSTAVDIPNNPPNHSWQQQIPLPEPDMAAVEQLTAMGFPQPQVMEALRQSHNNVEHAANRLLSGE